MSFTNKFCINKKLFKLVVLFVIIFPTFFLSVYISKNNLSNRSEAIIGGTDAAIGEFPFFVAIKIRDKFLNGLTHRCGGVLIKSNLIVTAKHCAGNNYQFNKDFYSIDVMGNDHVTNVSYKNFAVKEVIPYDFPPKDESARFNSDDYESWYHDNDIMLLILNRPITGIKLPFLPKPDQGMLYDRSVRTEGKIIPTRQNVTAMGFGVNSVNPTAGDSPPYDQSSTRTTRPKLLQKIDIPIQVKTIKNRNNYFGFGFDIPYDNLNHTLSYGDSGGPILNGDYLIGIVSTSSRGFDYQRINNKGVKIINYLQWIEDNYQIKAKSKD